MDEVKPLTSNLEDPGELFSGSCQPRFVLPVVSVLYEPGIEILEMVDSLLAESKQSEIDVKLFLVNNSGAEWNSQETSRSLLDELAARGAEILSTGKNLGYGKAVNYAHQYFKDLLELMSGFVVVNPDVVWHSGAIAALCDQGVSNHRAGVIGPATFEPDGTPYWSAREIPRLGTGIAHACLGSFWPQNPWTRRYRRADADFNKAAKVGWVSGSCMWIREAAFLAVKGFDENFFMFFEDVDLCEQITGAGWECWYVPQARITHKRSVSWRERPTAMIRAHHQSAAYYLSKVYSKWWQKPLLAVVKIGIKVRESLLAHQAGKKNGSPTG